MLDLRFNFESIRPAVLSQRYAPPQTLIVSGARS